MGALSNFVALSALSSLAAAWLPWENKNITTNDGTNPFSTSNGKVRRVIWAPSLSLSRGSVEVPGATWAAGVQALNSLCELPRSGRGHQRLRSALGELDH